MQRTSSFPAAIARPGVRAERGDRMPPAACDLPSMQVRESAPASNVAGSRGSPPTEVVLLWRAGEREDWLKFGRPIAERIVDRRRRIECYAAGQVFALVRWASNDYGTVRSTLAIVRAVAPGERCTAIAQVDPGGELLLLARGWSKVARVFLLIDAIEASGIDPCDVAPEHWRHVHNRLAGRERPRSYTPPQHRAWLLRKALQP